ncbi:hypothetical protein CPTC_00606 [Corynebacterium pseudotuberculosis]|nr:hypothetical protein CPTC_00606 [Corynebacterium pseudotuberculosis]AQL50182.1 hypothetical protein CpPA04_0062 [Corynebacterium pseudotuberculosis]
MLNGVVFPALSRVQKATKAPFLVGVVRAVRICHVVPAISVIPDW